jgi:hypothetical protein
LSETTHSTQVYQQQTNNIVTALSLLAQEAAKASVILPMSYATTAPQLNTLGIASSSDPNTNWILQRVQQLVHDPNQQQRNCTLPSNTDNWISAALSNEIRQQRAAIKRRHDALVLEYKSLQFKDGLLETVMSCARTNPVAETNGNLVQMLANMSRGLAASEPMKMSALQALLQSSHPNIASAARTPRAGNLNDLYQNLQLPQTPSLGMSPIQAMLVQAARERPASDASLGNLINLLNQLHQPVCPDNLRLMAHILGSEQFADLSNEAAEQENTRWM